jgi:DNA-binding NarL/FixJ family response regulator
VLRLWAADGEPHRRGSPSYTSDVIKVVLAEDNALLRDGLSRMIDAQDDLQLVGACGSLDELLATVDRSEPDVVVTDIRMPPTGTDEGVRAATTLRRTHPSTGVVVLSQYVSTQYAMAVLDGGSEGRGYLLKDRVAATDDLLDAIRTVAAGGAVIDPKVVEQLVSSSRRRPRSPLDDLTPREREVLAAMAEGRTNMGVATLLGISEGATEKHISNIFGKLELPDSENDHRRVLAVLTYLGS